MDIEQEIREFIGKELARDAGHVDRQASLLEAGILDSLGVLALVSFIEGRYGIGISDDDLLPENFDSIDAIATFVAQRQAREAS